DEENYLHSIMYQHHAKFHAFFSTFNIFNKPNKVSRIKFAIISYKKYCTAILKHINYSHSNEY
ncbi:MAG: hypothetical protein PV354_03115, partial [Bartonella sp.]|nr:hypothetical protein [Bartonella sp.]